MQRCKKTAAFTTSPYNSDQCYQHYETVLLHAEQLSAQQLHQRAGVRNIVLVKHLNHQAVNFVKT